MLARSKLNSIEGKISEALVNNQISHENFMTIIYEERSYRELKESIRIVIIKKKGDKLYVKWKEYDNSFNNWIDKKRLSKMNEIPIV